MIKPEGNMNLMRRKLFQSLGLLIGVYALSSQQKVLADGFQNMLPKSIATIDQGVASNS